MIFSILSLYFLLIYFIFGKNFLNPNIFFSGYWILNIILGVFLSEIINSYYFFDGIFVIAFHILIFNIGGLFIHHFFPKKIGGGDYIVNVALLRNIMIFFNSMSILMIMIFLQSKDKDFTLLINLEQIFELANESSIDRYNEVGLPISYKILSIFLYSSIFLGAFLFKYKANYPDIVISLFPLIISFINAILNGARAGLMMSILLFISVLFVIRIIKREKTSLYFITKFMIILIFSFVFIFFLIQAVRGGKIDIDIFTLIDKLQVYAIGSFNAFTIWWHTHTDLSFGFGQYTFSGLYDLLVGGRQVGLFTEPVMISQYSSTNVYTVFRSTIEDFSLFGSLTLFFIFGLISSICFKFIFTNRLFIVVLSTCFFVILWSFITNPIMYNTILFSWILNMFIIILLVKKYEKV